MEKAQPYKAIDTILLLEEGKIEISLNLDDNDLFKGHFPFLSIFPGVFIIEMVEQTALHYFNSISIHNGHIFKLNKIISTRFYAPIKPGDTLRCSCRIETLVEDKFKVLAVCSVFGKEVAKLNLEFYKKGYSYNES